MHFLVPAAADAAPKFHRDLISPIGSESATNGGGGKVVTFTGKTHVVWQDPTKQGYFNRLRSLDHASGEWSETFTLHRTWNGRPA